MKHFYIAIIIINILTFLVSCEKSIEPQSIKLSTNDIFITYSCDSVNIFVQANCEWTLTGKSDWCSTLIKSGNGDSSVDFIINVHSEEDTIRTAIFEFVSNDGSSKCQLKISQSPGYFLNIEVNRDTIMAEGDIIVIPFVTNFNDVKIVIPSSINWIHELDTKSIHSDTILMVVDENTGNERMAQLELHYGEKIKSYIIVQKKCIPLEKIDFIAGTPLYSYGEKEIQLKCSFVPENATNKKLLWSSSNESLCSVTQEGLVHTFPKNGICVITTKNMLSNVEATYSIQCYDPKIPIKISGSTNTLLQNSYLQLSVNKPQSIVKWSTQDESLATVNNNGSIKSTLNKTGLVDIYANNLDDGSIDKYQIEIVDLIATARGGRIVQAKSSFNVWFVADITGAINIILNNVWIIDNYGRIRYTSSFSDFENNYSTNIKFRSGCIVLNINTMNDATLDELSTWWMKITYSSDNGTSYKNKDVFINAYSWGWY